MKVFKEFFNLQIIEDPNQRVNHFSDQKYKIVRVSPKYSPNKNEYKSYNRFDENNFLNKFPFQNNELYYNKVNLKGSKDELNSDLQFIPEHPEYRAQTSIGFNRRSNPSLNQNHEALIKPSTSPHGTRQKINENCNKYYTLIEEAIKMTSENELSKKSNRIPTTSMYNSESEMAKSSSGKIKISKFSLSASNSSKLKSQFHSKPKVVTSNAKDLIRKSKKFKLKQSAKGILKFKLLFY